jgi:hypothetical protein
MFICDKCHKADRKVLDCGCKSHLVSTNSNCDVCGKYAKVSWCYAYVGKLYKKEK